MMSSINKIFGFVLATGISLSSLAQNPGSAYWLKTITLDVNQDIVSVDLPNAFNAFSIRLDSTSLDQVEVYQEKDTFSLEQDPHFSLETSSRVQSQLVNFSTDITRFTLNFNGFRGNIDLRVQYVERITNTGRVDNRRLPCEHPAMVSQSTWRAGLPAPTPGREKTETKHCIIHHSGDGNGNSDYTQLVRSYYIHHTQTNGWDDIGYNYLVADDGTLFAGRDPELPGIDQDNVKGAHFCSKNSSTMGVCLIGNFTSTDPSVDAISTLTDLLTWKLDKEYFTAFQSFSHPKTNDPLLGTIAAHKEGCNTVCPGNNVFSILDDIRDEVSQKLDLCSTVGLSEVESSSMFVVNPANYELIINFDQPVTGELIIMDNFGRKIFDKKILNLSSFETSVTRYETGIYYILFQSSNTTQRLKFIKN
jgi:hypothetical protein